MCPWELHATKCGVLLQQPAGITGIRTHLDRILPLCPGSSLTHSSCFCELDDEDDDEDFDMARMMATIALQIFLSKPAEKPYFSTHACRRVFPQGVGCENGSDAYEAYRLSLCAGDENRANVYCFYACRSPYSSITSYIRHKWMYIL